MHELNKVESMQYADMRTMNPQFLINYNFIFYSFFFISNQVILLVNYSLQVYLQSQDDKLTACDLEVVLKELVNPNYLLHVTALRSQLKNLLNNSNNNIDDYEDDQSFENDQSYIDDYFYGNKRSLSSIARNGLLNNGKRNIAALARMNMLRQPTDDIKRSIATLAKNGQLPSKEPETDETPASQWTMEKRNIGALARSGLLGGKRNIASLARNYDFSPYGKRNLASLVRMGMNPSYTPKRNIASLARSNLIPYFAETKKNVGALARDWSLPKSSSKINAKREIHQNQVKRRLYLPLLFNIYNSAACLSFSL